MPWVKLVLSYDGTRYVGWQVQPNGPSIQAELERALGDAPQGAGARHRRRAHRLRRPRARAGGELRGGAPPSGDGLREGDERAPAGGRRGSRRRRSARRPSTRGATRGASATATGSRTCPPAAPLTRLQAWQVFRPLDVAAMRAAAAPLLGRHDFGAFRAADCEAGHAVRELRRLDVVPDGRGAHRGGGRGHRLPEAHGAKPGGDPRRGRAGRPHRRRRWRTLLARRDRKLAGRTAPPQGLVLDEVFYEE